MLTRLVVQGTAFLINGNPDAIVGDDEFTGAWSLAALLPPF